MLCSDVQSSLSVNGPRVPGHEVGVQALHTLIDVSLEIDFCRFLLPGRQDLPEPEGPDWFLYPLHALN